MAIMKKIAVIAVVVVLAGATGYWFIWGRSDDDPNLIRISGNIEVTDAEVSFKLAGRVDERRVDEGKLVEQNDIVAVLDSSELESELALRRAELDAAQAALAELEAGSRLEEIAAGKAARDKTQAFLSELEAGSRAQEIKAAEAKVNAANAKVTHLQRDLKRLEEVRESKAVSQEEYDHGLGEYQVAAAEEAEAEEHLNLVKEGPREEQIAQARAALAQANAEYDLVKAGPRKETIQQARAHVEQAKAAVALAETRLSYAKLVSPLSGIVLSKNIEPGEFVAAGTPVVTVGDLEHVWLRAYISETDLGRVKVGQPVRVTTDTYPDKPYEGRISFVASEAEFTPKNVQTSQERVKLVYRVKIDIGNPNMELKPGMPADAEIVLGENQQSAE
jgi:HlyD family secretion protein